VSNRACVKTKAHAKARKLAEATVIAEKVRSKPVNKKAATKRYGSLQEHILSFLPYCYAPSYERLLKEMLRFESGVLQHELAKALDERSASLHAKLRKLMAVGLVSREEMMFYINRRAKDMVLAY
jgi:ERCC4-type nuclease